MNLFYLVYFDATETPELLRKQFQQWDAYEIATQVWIVPYDGPSLTLLVQLRKHLGASCGLLVAPVLKDAGLLHIRNLKELADVIGLSDEDDC